MADARDLSDAEAAEGAGLDQPHPRRQMITAAAGMVAGGLAGGALLRPGVAAADVPDGSVTPASFAASAIDPAANVPGARTLGSGTGQAASGAALAGALADIDEFVAGDNITIADVGAGTKEIGVAFPAAFEGGSSKVTIGEFGSGYINVIDKSGGSYDAYPNAMLSGEALGVGLGHGGPSLSFGTGAAVPDLSIARGSNGDLLVNGQPFGRSGLLGSFSSGFPVINNDTTTNVATFSIGAGRFRAGDVVSVVVGGAVVNNTGASANFQLIFRIAGTMIITGTFGLASSASPRLWQLAVQAVVGSGATSQQVTATSSISGATSGVMAANGVNATGFASGSMNMGAAHDITVAIKHGTTNSLMQTNTGLAYATVVAP